jgi:hypothetical protein
VEQIVHQWLGSSWDFVQGGGKALIEVSNFLSLMDGDGCEIPE